MKTVHDLLQFNCKEHLMVTLKTRKEVAIPCLPFFGSIDEAEKKSILMHTPTTHVHGQEHVKTLQETNKYFKWNFCQMVQINKTLAEKCVIKHSESTRCYSI